MSMLLRATYVYALILEPLVNQKRTFYAVITKAGFDRPVGQALKTNQQERTEKDLPTHFILPIVNTGQAASVPCPA